jgi:hypothetical protein
MNLVILLAALALHQVSAAVIQEEVAIQPDPAPRVFDHPSPGQMSTRDQTPATDTPDLSDSFVRDLPSAGPVPSEVVSAVPPLPAVVRRAAASAWFEPSKFSNLKSFKISNFATGEQNLRIVSEASVPALMAASPSTTPASVLQIFYPNGSVDPGHAGVADGGSEFYSSPLTITKANSVTLQYKVFFPADFNFVLGGKLPGLYGGHTGCSGGDDASSCFSTRLMWRTNGSGELYLVSFPALFATLLLLSHVPRSRSSVCTQESADG